MIRIYRLDYLDSAKWYTHLRKFHWSATAEWNEYLAEGAMSRTRFGAMVSAVIAVITYRFKIGKWS